MAERVIGIATGTGTAKPGSEVTDAEAAAAAKLMVTKTNVEIENAAAAITSGSLSMTAAGTMTVIVHVEAEIAEDVAVNRPPQIMIEAVIENMIEAGIMREVEIAPGIGVVNTELSWDRIDVP